MTMHIEISPSGSSFSVRVRTAGGAFELDRPGVSLGPEAMVTVRDEQVPLVRICDAAREPDYTHTAALLDRRGQVAVGEYLWNEVFGDRAAECWNRLPNIASEIRIVTTDERIARLPWNLMGREGGHCVLRNVMVALATRTDHEPAELPPLPHVLVVAPQPRDRDPTAGAAHLDEFEAMLRGADPRYAQGGQRLRIVRSWQEFLDVRDFKADVVYYYGHGFADGDSAELWFENENGLARAVPLADFANALLRVCKPVIVYLNCCQGDAAGYLGAGFQFGDRVPALVANRATATVDLARKQGMLFWRRVLLDGADPGQAVRELYLGYLEQGLDSNSVHWMTPVLYRHYSKWQSSPLLREQPSRMGDPSWHLKVDRVPQASRILYEIETMFQQGKPRSQAYTWYGKPGHGCELLVKRLRVDFDERLRDTKIVEFAPEWPQVAEPGQFRNMLLQAFGIQRFEDVPAALRRDVRANSDTRVLAYIRHTTVKGQGVINPASLRQYLDLWNREVAPHFSVRNFAVLGTAFVVEKPQNFAEAMIKHGPPADGMALTGFTLLDELKSLTRQDLVHFLNRHKIEYLPADFERTLDAILQRTGGAYEATVEELEKAVIKLWEKGTIELTPNSNDPTPDFDY